MNEVKRISWSKFKALGLLEIVNKVIRLFGVQIIVQTSIRNEKEIVTDVYPAIVNRKNYTIYKNSLLKKKEEKSSLNNN